MCAKFRCAALRSKKALGIFRELIPITRTTRVTFWDPPIRVQNRLLLCANIVRRDTAMPATYGCKLCGRRRSFYVQRSTCGGKIRQAAGTDGQAY